MTDFEPDQRVIHHQYGTGTVVKTDASGHGIMVDFDTRGNQIIDDRDLEPQRDLLHDVTVDEGPEWADEAVSEGESGVFGGEVEIALNFAENVEYDVDAHDDGTITIQYWSENR